MWMKREHGEITIDSVTAPATVTGESSSDDRESIKATDSYYREGGG